MPLNDLPRLRYDTTTRRTIVKTGAKLAYDVPIVAASMKLSEGGVGADHISGHNGVTCLPTEVLCSPNSPKPVCCPIGPTRGCCAVVSGSGDARQRCHGCIINDECFFPNPNTCFRCIDFPGEC